MSKREKIGFAILLPIVISCAVLNITTDYVARYSILKTLNSGSIVVLILQLIEMAKRSREKNKDSN